MGLMENLTSKRELLNSLPLKNSSFFLGRTLKFCFNFHLCDMTVSTLIKILDRVQILLSLMCHRAAQGAILNWASTSVTLGEEVGWCRKTIG